MSLFGNSSIIYSHSSASLYNNSIHCSKVPGNMASEEEKLDIKHLQKGRGKGNIVKVSVNPKTSFFGV
jgi:hypothetical protein